MTVLISGGGIAGLTLGLTLHQIGIPFRIYESVPEIRPLGVGINLQPNAVRELFDLGLEREMAAIGVATRDYGFYTKKGLEIWTEPRGIWAGYNWPQYSVHRGQLQMLLHRTLLEKAGAGSVVSGQRATGFETIGDDARLHLTDTGTGQTSSTDGTLLIGADGIHSALRRQMEPAEGDPIWGGAVMWRGTTVTAPFLSGASMILMGHDTQRLVAYPISPPDVETGLATINWIAELSYEPAQGWNKEDWNREATPADFLPNFEDWTFDWLDAPALIRGADKVYEYPMVDRDPIERWTYGPVTLMGDAAHPTYPVGSNGASQAILDARIIGANLLAHGVGPDALKSYEGEVRPLTANVTRANRGSGPDAIMQMVEDRCGGAFDRIEDVMPKQELADHAAKYKALAGFSIQALNERPDLISIAARRG
jgi:2-polyprenyl-6-methoxyphenol hydroxylase-like FAD-dependent oxidoreductase